METPRRPQEKVWHWCQKWDAWGQRASRNKKEMDQTLPSRGYILQVRQAPVGREEPLVKEIDLLMVTRTTGPVTQCCRNRRGRGWCVKYVQWGTRCSLWWRRFSTKEHPGWITRMRCRCCKIYMLARVLGMVPEKKGKEDEAEQGTLFWWVAPRTTHWQGGLQEYLGEKWGREPQTDLKEIPSHGMTTGKCSALGISRGVIQSMSQLYGCIWQARKPSTCMIS